MSSLHYVHPEFEKVALELLCDSVFDALLTQDIAFDDAPAQLAQALAADSSGLTTVLTYT